MDWQQIIVLVLVLAAAYWLIQRWLSKRKSSCGCDEEHCASSAAGRLKK